MAPFFTPLPENGDDDDAGGLCFKKKNKEDLVMSSLSPASKKPKERKSHITLLLPYTLTAMDINDAKLD